MSKAIEGVPESITRDDYVEMFKRVGLDPDTVSLLEFKPDGIYATCDELDSNGHIISTPTAEDEFAVAQHRIYVPVTDEASA